MSHYLSKSNGNFASEDHLPPEARRNARKMLEATEPEGDETKSVSFGRIGGRNSQRGVRFISGQGIDGHKGKVFSRDYSHYLGCDEEGDTLVVTFTDRRVTLTGRCLCWPPETSLVRYFTDHKVAVIETVPEERDGFAATGEKPRNEPVVHRINVEVVK